VLPIGEVLATRYGLDRTPVDQGELPTYSEALWTPPAPEPVALERERERRVKVDPDGERRVLISLSQQYLWAYQGDAVLWEGYISTGTEKFATPPGSFQVLSKLESQTMEGVLGGEYYNVPDVPDVMYFTDRGHAIHGAYWHNNFGTPMSHGCINLPMDVSKQLYDWAPPGTPVLIVP
jgi:lipoprotein-anchoring transpeptidase ErfK/SrfK